VVLLWAAWAGAVGAAGWSPQEKAQSLDAAEETIATFKLADPALASYFKQAYGYAWLPACGNRPSAPASCHWTEASTPR